jgi:DHA1 family bicyclomycin/chloramphenicol resistance-like MFS transporter
MMTLTFCMFGFIGTNFNALALDPLGHVAGTASSVLGFMQTLGGGLIGALIGAYYDGTLLPLYAGFTVLSLGSLACVYYAEGGRLFGRPREKHEHAAEVAAQTR